MQIIIETIEHEAQRYRTVGDWFYDETQMHIDQPVLHIKVSKLGDWRYEALVAIHELAEVLACKHDGVTQEMVDKFDMEFESNRHPDNQDEPGDAPDAPYRNQHCMATGIERVMAAALGVSWNDYNDAVESLP